MKRFIFVIIFILSVVVSYIIWDNSPEYLRQGGPLLVLGLTCLFLVFTFTVERAIVLTRAGGRGGVSQFMRNIKTTVQEGQMEKAIETCKKQGGCLGNVVGAGLERYRATRAANESDKDVMEETKRTIEEATALESPILERNLNALSTIASIATMLGLLGTTIGMIRSFHAMGQAGAPDAIQLAIGISEALVNTALGLTTAIIGIVLYNYFAARVDNFLSAIEETSFEVLDLLRQTKGS
ncbi:MAG: MotA/TolQ/ExbB proton channel family protein [Chitinivibrionia bacterium]|nr:MotA/TolQ/ExbB proton channel family protein [Chitinivibrionia bacterium]